MMVGRKISLVVEKSEAKPKDIILSVKDLNIKSNKSSKNIIKNVSFEVRAGEIVCIAGEILDVDGICGGYNLQWAWSSGFVAGSQI